MQLLAFSCNNIGPFFDRTITVSFLDGKYLIKAPIGSGKSFLFFDGPLFGLYKTSSRPMLSMKAETGRIKTLFVHEDKIIVTQRDIGRTKAGNDTVKSSLFVIDMQESDIKKLLTQSNADNNQNDVLMRDFDGIANLMNTPTVRASTEPIVAKNETDIQQTLESFLPPKEVFLSTSMLLQDSANVFELAPAERISLFKEIFGLINIDSATDRINEEKRMVSATLKAKGDTSIINRNLQSYLTNLGQEGVKLQQIFQGLPNTLLDQIHLIQDKITIIDFSLDAEWNKIIDDSRVHFTALHNEGQKKLGAQEQARITTEKSQKELAQLETQIQQAQQTLLTIEKQLQTDSSATIATFQEKLRQHEKAFSHWLHNLPAHRFTNTESTNTQPTNTQTITKQDFFNIRTSSQELTNEAKLLWEQEKFLQKNIEQLLEQHKENQQTLQNYEKNVQQLEENYESKKRFHCEKTGADCPFIEQINTGFFSSLQKNILSAQETVQAYKEKLQTQDLPTRIQEQQTALEKQKKLLEEKKTIPALAYRKEIENEKKQYDIFMQQEIALQNESKHFQEQQTFLADLAVKKAQQQERIQLLQSTYEQTENTVKELQKTFDAHELQTIKESIQTAENGLVLSASIQQTVNRINDLVHTHKETQREIKQLTERERLLTDLYRIFSKELMIKVLEDALPFFAEFVNNLLAKMVSFSVIFQPKKTTGDKLELEIIVRDTHGERTVKSLSGGQKAILRLAWILGVAQMTSVKQLFLDETINNIDQDTIAQVTEMLKDYTKLNNISLYLVTHSQQLQEMSIWDKEIEII